MKLTILHIEDDQEIGSWVSKFLTDCGYEVIWITSGQEAMKHMERTDLVILDIMLPGLDGFTIGQRLKQKYPNTPIMMLSARTSMEDKLHGLTFADDYMTKPYHPVELAARIQVLIRRLGIVSPEIIQIMHLQIDQKANRISNTISKTDIVLTGKHFISLCIY